MGLLNLRIRHRIFSALLALGILALLLSTLSLVINQGVRTKPASAVATLPAGVPPLSFTSFLTSYINHGEKITPSLQAAMDRPYVTFTADTLSPSEDTIDGTLSVVLPPGFAQFITDGKGTPVFGKGTTNVLRPYANDVITIKVLVTRTSVNKEFFFTVPLKDYSAGSNLGLHEFPVTIPVNGYSGWYPQDRYTDTLTVAMALPDGWGPSIATGAESVVHTVDGGTVADSYHVSITPSDKKFNDLESNAPDTFNVTITRDWYNQFFVFTVALIPILFAVLFFHLLFVSGGRYGIGRSFEHFTEALVVSILSVLPLRVVLVPGDISGLTRVDLVLGVGLVLIVTVAAGKYAQEIWATGSTSAPREHHEPEVWLSQPTRESDPAQHAGHTPVPKEFWTETEVEAAEDEAATAPATDIQPESPVKPVQPPTESS
jgi:hypothetical protein